MSTIKNVAIVGAAGALGTPVFQKIVASGKFSVKVIRRNGSKTAYPPGTNVVDVDFNDVSALTEALNGQDAVVSTIATTAVDQQPKLIDAAVAAGVKRFLPSEFGSDLSNPKTRQLPVFGHKVAAQEQLIKAAGSGPITYTFIQNSAFLDWGLEHDFILAVSKGKQPVIYDGGDSVFSSTTLSTVADAVVGVLEHPEETKNRTVFIEDIKVTQNQLLKLAKEVAPERDWTPKHVKIDDLTNQSDNDLATGNIGPMTFVNYLFRAVMDPAYGGDFQKTDNELLGLKGKTEKDIKEIIAKLVN